MLRIINDVSDHVKSGAVISVEKLYDDYFENNNVEFIRVHAGYFPDYFGSAIQYYHSQDFSALQLVWTDRNNKFPWQEDFQEEFIYKQPLLDRNIDFKFREARNLAVFTTNQWFHQGKPIVRVVHDRDGDWQFLTGDQTLADTCVVALEQMTMRDPTLNEIFNLNYGEFATRNYLGGYWERRTLEVEDDETN